MIEPIKDLEGKVVIVTGGNRGIGEGCATAFCRCGCQVVIAGRDKPLGDNLAARLTESEPGTCVFFRCDVTKAEEVRDLVSHAVQTFGRLDCCVNNAGYFPKRRPIDEVSIEDFEEVLRTNLIGVFSGCKYSLPHLRRTKGCIINMSSILGAVGQEGSCIYAATKGAIISLTKSLAMDEARNEVRVNVVVPGNIHTEIGKRNRDDSLSSEQRTRLSNMVQWMGRKGTPIEVGWTCVYLASSMASFVTGTEVFVTGGYELGGGLRLTQKERVELLRGLL